MTPALTVLGKAGWQIHWAGCNNPGGGIGGQVTKCRLADGTVVYVRENLERNHFLTSSNARIGMKRGEKGNAVEVLEVCCPPERWDEVAALVEAMDTKGRRVRKHRLFTYKWAEEAMRGGRR